MRGQIFACLLSACILLAASPFSYFTSGVQAVPPVHFKLRALQLQPSSLPHYGNVMRAWDEDKRTRKTPSGPNPVGNHQPPSKP